MKVMTKKENFKVRAEDSVDERKGKIFVNGMLKSINKEGTTGSSSYASPSKIASKANNFHIDGHESADERKGKIFVKGMLERMKQSGRYT